LAKPGVLHLFADGHPVPGLQELRHVRLERVVREPGKRYLAGRPVPPPGERDAEDAGGDFRVLFKRLEEIPHAEEKYRAGVLRLHLGVLRHQRGGHERN
jgi:hypothetical protein